MSDSGFGTPPFPTAGVDGRVALATSMHAMPGVYAVLLGSGVSSGAGIPTGWQVVQDLIRKVAIAEGVDVESQGQAPEEWWIRQGRPEPRYDNLLAALAPTDAARQAMLRGYFEPKNPATPGHDSLAWLCATGRVRAIITTNFDRLVERALDRFGMTPQVLSSPSNVSGMTPLTHAGVTVIKLHGDYAAGALRNSRDELSVYPKEWDDLLDRVFDEFGLVAVGWSADYDRALCQALGRSPNHRYPVFWTRYQQHLSDEAKWLIENRRATVIDVASADEFLVDLAQRIERLDQGATRRERPTALKTYLFPPESTTAPQGWVVLPLLQLTAVAAVSPVTTETVGIIRPESRDALVQALNGAVVTQGLRAMAASPAQSALAEPSAQAQPDPLVQWIPTPNGNQSTEYATYRLGGDASSGVSALISIRLPSYGVGGQVVIKLDMALSLERTVRVGEAARLFRDGLLLVSDAVPKALADILPGDADVTQVELHFLAAGVDGANHNRPNDIPQRLDLTQFGNPSRTVGPQLGFAARVNGSLSEHDAAEVVVEGFDHMTLGIGYLDPRNGVARLRSELGLPAAT